MKTQQKGDRGENEGYTRPQNVAFATYNPKSNLKQLAIMKQIRWAIKQTLKMTVQHILLPLVYAFWQAVFRKRVPGLIVFADAHHDTLPFSISEC